MRIAPLIAVAVLVTSARAASVAEVFNKVKDAVVIVKTTEREAPDVPGGEATASSGLGSGVLISKEGRILTAAHVVQVAESIFVEIPGGETLSAKVVASEPSADVALIQLERPPTNPVVAILGDSDAVRVGDEVFVVGAPLGMSHSVTVGHISGRRTVSDLFGGFESAEMFQTDAAINAGNSGGPMFDMEGHVIGVVSHVLSGAAGNGGLGFAATSGMAKSILLDRRGIWSGLEGHLLQGEQARIFQLPQARGILVQRVAAKSPAAKVGLMGGTQPAVVAGDTFLVGGDVILSVEGISIAEADSAPRIREKLATRKPGAPVSVVVLRGGRRLELQGVPDR